MDYIQDRSRSINFSLQESRIKEIKFHNKTLRLSLTEYFNASKAKRKNIRANFGLKRVIWSCAAC